MNDNQQNKNTRSLLVFALVIVALVAVVVIGIELARRSTVNAPNNQTPIAENSADKPFPREIKDASGETLVIPEKPQRIVSQTLGTDEVLVSICPPERIAALSNLAGDANYSNVVEQAQIVPGRVTQGAEQILQMKPDLIFIASYSRAEVVELLKASKAPIFRFANFTSLDDIKNNIRIIGYATGCDQNAENLIAQMNNDLASIRARVPKLEKPLRVLSYDDGYTAGANTTFDEMLGAVGATNVSRENGVDGFAKLSPEKIAEWQPDFIVAGANKNELETKKKQILSDPVIAASRAGKAGNVVIIESRHLLAVSQFFVKGVEDLFDGLYGKNSNLK